jgi:hypothetical protein
MWWELIVEVQCRDWWVSPVTLNPGASSTPAAGIHVQSPVPNGTPILGPLGHPGQPRWGNGLPHNGTTISIRVAKSQRLPSPTNDVHNVATHQRDTSQRPCCLCQEQGERRNRPPSP